VSSGVAQQATPTPPQKPVEKKPTEPPQEPGDLDVVKITTNLVQIDAVITDKNGKQVTDLRPEELEMLVDGKPQVITNFSYVSVDTPDVAPVAKATEPKDSKLPLPPRIVRPENTRRTLAFVVDDISLSAESTYYVRRTLRKFLDEQMRPTDLVAIIRTAGGTGVLQQFTTDKRQLYAAVEKVKWLPGGRGGQSPFEPLSSDGLPATRQRVEDDVMKDDELAQFRQDVFTVGTLSVLNYVITGLRQLPGRKSVIFLSDGISIRSRDDNGYSNRILQSLRILLDQANRASVVFNTVDPRGLQTLGLTAADSIGLMDPQRVMVMLSARRNIFFDSQEGLILLASETGGLAIRNTNDLSAGVQKVLIRESGYYVIGYRPDDATFDRAKDGIKFHRVSLKVKRPGKYNVQMRKGFFGVTDEAYRAQTDTPKHQLISALISPFASSNVQLRLTSLFGNDPELGSIMRSFLHIKASDLTFTKQPDGKHKAVFQILAVTFGENGRIVDQFSYEHTIRVTDANLPNLRRDGFTYNVTLPIKKPGAYQLRVALLDQPSARVGSATQFVEVPNLQKQRLTTSGLLLRAVPLQVYLRGGGSVAESKDGVGEDDPQGSIAVRQYQTGMALLYGFVIYNAKIDKATGKPSLKTQVRMFRNGELIFTGDEIPFDVGGQTDLTRLGVSGGIQLGTAMTPGEYVLQVIVTDLLASEKKRIATQWMDFEIVK
jgi:VWFA-related protein